MVGNIFSPGVTIEPFLCTMVDLGSRTGGYEVASEVAFRGNPGAGNVVTDPAALVVLSGNMSTPEGRRATGRAAPGVYLLNSVVPLGNLTCPFGRMIEPSGRATGGMGSPPGGSKVWFNIGS